MVKIKDDVDLKKLEELGYINTPLSYEIDRWFGTKIYINKKTRKITRLHPYSLREEPVDDEIRDLIKADLIEKVEEKND